jgi:hypothetical protein
MGNKFNENIRLRFRKILARNLRRGMCNGFTRLSTSTGPAQEITEADLR